MLELVQHHTARTQVSWGWCLGQGLHIKISASGLRGGFVNVKITREKIVGALGRDKTPNWRQGNEVFQKRENVGEGGTAEGRVQKGEK